MELNKKLEAEVAKIQKDIEECKIQCESMTVSLKKKQQDSVSEMTEQVEQLLKMTNKINKDKSAIINEASEVRAATEEVIRSKSSAEKKLRELTASLNEISKKVEVAQLNLVNYEANKRKSSAENGDLLRQVQELENSANLLIKSKECLVHALDEMKGVADHEAKDIIALLGKFRTLELNVDGLNDILSDEALGKENIAHQLNKALGDVDMWRKKYKLAGLAKSEEIEMANLKLQACLLDSQNMIEQLN